MGTRARLTACLTLLLVLAGCGSHAETARKEAALRGFVVTSVQYGGGILASHASLNVALEGDNGCTGVLEVYEGGDVTLIITTMDGVKHYIKNAAVNSDPIYENINDDVMRIGC